MSDHSSAAELKSRGDANDPATFEFAVPGDWPSRLAIAFAKLMDKALQDGLPIVVPIRQDATAEQISRVFEDARTLVERAGLPPAVEPPA